MRGFISLIVLSAAVLPALASAQGSGVTPGQWEIAVTVDSMESSTLPPAIAKMMIGKTVRIKHCITPEDAAKGPQEMLKSGKGCVFNDYSMNAGKMKSDMTCTSGGAVNHIVSSGAFTPTSFTSQGRAVMTGGAPMTTTSTSVGKLLGPCK